MNDRDVEACKTCFTSDEPWIRYPVPIGNITCFEIHISLTKEKCMEAEIFFTDVESGLSAITNHGVQPHINFFLGFPSAIILCSALHIFRIERIHTETLKLKCVQAFVNALKFFRNSRKQCLALS